MFEQFTDQMELNNTYKILKLQLVTYLNERELRSTTLTNVEKIDKDIPDLKMKKCPMSDQREIVIFDNIDNNSLWSTSVALNVVPVLLKMTKN